MLSHGLAYKSLIVYPGVHIPDTNVAYCFFLVVNSNKPSIQRIRLLY